MRTLKIHAAEPIGDQEQVAATIEIAFQMPARSKTDPLEQVMELFKNDAFWLEDVLINALPGGTYDQLLSAMLQRKASHFVVSFNS